MKALGMSFTGQVSVQILDTLPTFQSSDIGRLIYCADTEISWIGGQTKWFNITLYDKCVTANHINWDITENNMFAVNASKIPTYYNEKETTIQEAFNAVVSDLNNIRNADTLGDKVIMGRHINGACVDGFTAEDMYLRDLYGQFKGNAYTVSVEEAFYRLITRTAEDIKLGKNSSFGSLVFGGSNRNVQEALDNIESYMADFTGDKVKVDCCNVTGSDSWCEQTNLQVALSSMCDYLANLRLVELKDTPDDYGECGQYLRTCGDGDTSCEGCSPSTMPKTHWSKVRASDVSCLFDMDASYKFDDMYVNTNMQLALNRIEYFLKNRTIPIGCVIISPMGKVKPGFLPCLGGFYNISEYPLLFEEIGYYFGQSGTQFAVPNYYDVHLRGNRDGRDYHSYEPDQLLSHNHIMKMCVQMISDQGGAWTWGNGNNCTSWPTTELTGSSENKVRNRSVLYIIRAY